MEPFNPYLVDIDMSAEPATPDELAEFYANMPPAPPPTDDEINDMAARADAPADDMPF